MGKPQIKSYTPDCGTVMGRPHIKSYTPDCGTVTTNLISNHTLQTTVL